MFWCNLSHIEIGHCKHARLHEFAFVFLNELLTFKLLLRNTKLATILKEAWFTTKIISLYDLIKKINLIKNFNLRLQCHFTAFGDFQHNENIFCKATAEKPVIYNFTTENQQQIKI